MQSHKFKVRVSNILVLYLVFMILSGCTVLTKSQIEEVGKFAKASDSYSELPGTLAQLYGELLRNSKLLIVARKSFGQVDEKGRIDTTDANEAWETICDAYKAQTDFEAAGKRMDAALSILKMYSKLLSDLVSDNSIDALSDSAENFGKSIDDATEDYNKRYRADDPLGKVGGLIAMAVRSGGGLYIRAKQASILKTTLNDAAPLIARLMDDVKLIALEKFKPSLMNYENNYLQNDFKSLANNKKKIGVTEVSFVYDNLYKTRQAMILADKVANAADVYKQAHAELVKNTRIKKTMKEAIRQVEALSAEISAANKVKAEVNK